MRVPGWLLRHRITCEAYQGVGAYGARYADPQDGIPALVAEEVKLIRDATGNQVTSTAQIYAGPDFLPPAQSRITLPDGRVTKVISIASNTAPGLPVPENTVVMCE
ncbi:hypothetical protein E4K10_18205 [Streptomyces sp. T1317-0309]|nr:hypothetical protein E4K10_18205 [Streptomyces sp. T1317-0309]